MCSQDCKKGGCECSREVEEGDDSVEVYINKDLPLLCDAVCDKGELYVYQEFCKNKTKSKVFSLDQ